MKYTVITGASSGIGYATALAFAKRGKNLILVARREEKLKELKSQILNISPKSNVVIRLSDLSDLKQTYDLYNSLSGYKIETWINNAGLGDSSIILNEDLNKVENMLRVNIDSLTILSTLFVKDYADVTNTQLINVSSGLGYKIATGNVVYSASKYYVSAFSEGLAKELKNSDLKVKVLAPSITETEFFDKASNVKNIDYKTSVTNYHSAQEMAEFMLKLFDSDKVVGIVDEKHEFVLKDQIYPIIENF